MTHLSHKSVYVVNPVAPWPVLETPEPAVLPMIMELGPEIRRRRESRGWSQEELARRTGSKQQTIVRIESGETKHSRALPRIIDLLGIAQPRPAPSLRIATDTKDLPVYASAQGGPGEMVVSYEPIDYVTRPEPLASVRDGYAMYVVGDSMSPAFEQGDLILVHPHVPYRPTDDVVIFRKSNEESATIVKRLVRATADQWTLMQFTPARTFSLSRKEWPQCHVIIGKYSRR